ncbi:hypothetical protein ACOMHN_058513 [Nucella lapillus]
MPRCCPRQLTKPRLFIFTVLIALTLLLTLMPQDFSVHKILKSRLNGRRFMELISFNNEAEEEEESGAGMNCVHPELDPFDPESMLHYRKANPIDCSAAMEDWVFIANGTFRIARHALQRYGHITCQYSEIHRSGDHAVRYGPVVRNVSDGKPLRWEYLRTNCTSASGHNYSNFHAGVVKSAVVMKRLRDYHSARNEARDSRSARKKKAGKHERSYSGAGAPSLSSLNLSVFILGFDGLSRTAWARLLPNTRQYFLHTLGGIELERFNLVGDGTIGTVLPMLTGKAENELPPAGKRNKRAKPVDGFPWVWKDYVRHGYVTAYAEDMANGGTFQWRWVGFKDPPTDHYMRPFYISASTVYKNHLSLCLGSLKRHVLFMNWFRDLFDAYRDYPKFLYGFHGEISHDSNNQLQPVDNDLKIFLQDLDAKGYLNSTLLILKSDHGARYSSARSTDIGKLEERLPYFSFRFPPWFHERYPDIVRNMRTNAKRLTTPFDVHATLLDVLNRSLTSAGRLHQKAVSLFEEVPEARTCADAGISHHWCACLEWEPVNQSHPLVALGVRAAVRAINDYTRASRTRCAELRLLRITRSVRFILKHPERWRVMNFVSQPLPATAQLFRLSFTTLPGKGHFRVTCAVVPESGRVILDAGRVRRINSYGLQSACIVENHFSPLRSYCYCL